MPKVRRSRKKHPEGWELIEPTLEELDQKMKEGKDFFVGALASKGNMIYSHYVCIRCLFAIYFESIKSQYF